MIRDPFISILPVISKEPILSDTQKTPVKSQDKTAMKSKKPDPLPKPKPQPPKPPVVEIPELPDLDLSGTVVSPTKSYAILNGKIVQLGDIVDEVRIVEIRKREVAVFFHGETFLIRMDTH